MPNDPRNPREEFEKIHLPGAQFLDIDQVSAHTEENAALGLKHMMPSSMTFAKACGQLNQSLPLLYLDSLNISYAYLIEDMGITNDTHVILYRSSTACSIRLNFYFLIDMTFTAFSLLHGLCSCFE